MSQRQTQPTGITGTNVSGLGIIGTNANLNLSQSQQQQITMLQAANMTMVDHRAIHAASVRNRLL